MPSSRARPFSSAITARLAVAALALGVGACAATSNVDAEWTDSSLRGQATSFRGANVLVACEAPDVAVRNVCQDRLAAEVRARGATPVFVAADTVIVRDRPLDQQLLAGAARSNARAILVVTLTPVATENDRPSLSFGIGGFGLGSSSAVGGGVGVSTPVGEGRVVTGFAANGRLTDVASGRLSWTASRAAPPSKDLEAQFGTLSAALLDSAARAGFF